LGVYAITHQGSCPELAASGSGLMQGNGRDTGKLL
jgi:hypothetical protein